MSQRRIHSTHSQTSMHRSKLTTIIEVEPSSSTSKSAKHRKRYEDEGNKAIYHVLKWFFLRILD